MERGRENQARKAAIDRQSMLWEEDRQWRREEKKRSRQTQEHVRPDLPDLLSSTVALDAFIHLDNRLASFYATTN